MSCYVLSLFVNMLLLLVLNMLCGYILYFNLFLFFIIIIARNEWDTEWSFVNRPLTNMTIEIVLVLFFSMIAMIIDLNLWLKFFLCYETFFFTISVIMILCTCEINEMIIVLFLLWNTTFEVVLGLSVLFLPKKDHTIMTRLCKKVVPAASVILLKSSLS